MVEQACGGKDQRRKDDVAFVRIGVSGGRLQKAGLLFLKKWGNRELIWVRDLIFSSVRLSREGIGVYRREWSERLWKMFEVGGLSY